VCPLKRFTALPARLPLPCRLSGQSHCVLFPSAVMNNMQAANFFTSVLALGNNLE
jgi:hypothetical protein